MLVCKLRHWFILRCYFGLWMVKTSYYDFIWNLLNLSRKFYEMKLVFSLRSYWTKHHYISTRGKVNWESGSISFGIFFMGPHLYAYESYDISPNTWTSQNSLNSTHHISLHFQLLSINHSASELLIWLKMEFFLRMMSIIIMSFSFIL